MISNDLVGLRFLTVIGGAWTVVSAAEMFTCAKILCVLASLLITWTPLDVMLLSEYIQCVV